MNTTNERIFAKDTDMMFWQQDNCTQCAKAVWYNARLGRCPKHNCALQRDMEAQAGGEMEINERSFRVLHELDALQDIKNATIKEESHWWGFVAPDCKKWNSDGLLMPKTLRNEFVNALDRSIEIVKAKIEKL